MAKDLDSLTHDLDYLGRKKRQRKVRLMRWDTNEHTDADRLLMEGMGYTVQVHRMLVGDYGWDLREESWLHKHGFFSLVIERKTLADIRDVKRLAKQLQALRVMPGVFVIVLIDHRYDTDRKRAWSDGAVLNAEVSIQLGGHIHTTHCAAGNLATRLDELYLWSQKREHELCP